MLRISSTFTFMILLAGSYGNFTGYHRIKSKKLRKLKRRKKEEVGGKVKQREEEGKKRGRGEKGRKNERVKKREEKMRGKKSSFWNWVLAHDA